jgi:hypothetical protein
MQRDSSFDLQRAIEIRLRQIKLVGPLVGDAPLQQRLNGIGIELQRGLGVRQRQIEFRSIEIESPPAGIPLAGLPAAAPHR